MWIFAQGQISRPVDESVPWIDWGVLMKRFYCIIFYLWVQLRANTWWFLGVADTNDVIQKIEKTLNNTHTTTQKLTNNSFRNTKKHPNTYKTGPGPWKAD